MPRSSSLLWIGLLLLILLPTAAGRVLLDVAGGLLLVLLVMLSKIISDLEMIPGHKVAFKETSLYRGGIQRILSTL